MSVADSIKTVIGDSHPFFKLGALSFITLVVQQIVVNNAATPVFKLVVVALMVLALLGFVFQSIHNTINEENVIMPNLFNPLTLIVRGVQGTLALLPYVALIYFGITWISELLLFAPWVNYLILSLVFIVLFAFLMMAMVLFCRNFIALRAYNLPFILKHGGDFIVYSFVLAISLILIGGVVFFPVGYFIKLVFNYGVMFNFYIIFSSLFLLMVVAQYYSLLYFDYIDLNDT